MYWEQVKMKLYLVLQIIIACFLNSSAFGQAEKVGSVQNVNILCESDTITIYLPEGYSSIDTFNYMEGFIHTFIYPDSSTVSILCGSNAKLTLGKNQADELFSRKITFNYHDITYERVTAEMKVIFDEAFDMMEQST